MSEFAPGRMLEAHIAEQDRYEDRPLYEAMVDKCRRMGIAGATVCRGARGDRLPLVVIAVDTAENIARLAAAFQLMMDKGAIAVCDVRMRRVTR